MGTTRRKRFTHSAYKHKQLHALNKIFANKTKAGIIGIAESKLDYTVPNSEVNFARYDILKCNRNRSNGGAASYMRKDLCYNRRTLHFAFQRN